MIPRVLSLIITLSDCGKVIESGQNLITNGAPEIAGDSPWNVAIYSTAGFNSTQLICGATIISENLIVSGKVSINYPESRYEELLKKGSSQEEISKLVSCHRVRLP